MVSRDDRLLISELTRVLVAAFVAGGRKQKVVPPVQREAVRELMPRLFADPPLLREYLRSLHAERVRQGVDELLLVLPVADLPVERIAADGFDGLADDVLADLALCPDALEALQEQLYDNPELDAVKGDWLYNAQQVASRSIPSHWQPAHITVIHPRPSRKWLWVSLIGVGTAVTLSVIALILTLRPKDGVPPTDRAVPTSRPASGDSQPCILSTPAGSLDVKIVSHEMMRTSHPESPYRLTVATSEPVYLMHVFGWRNPAGWLWFSWHGTNHERTIPAGTTEVIYPDDREKRKFQGFAGYLLVFTSVPVPQKFWDTLETITREKSYAGRIDPTRDFLLEQLGKIGIPPEKVFIFAAVESTIQKE